MAAATGIGLVSCQEAFLFLHKIAVLKKLRCLADLLLADGNRIVLRTSTGNL